MATTPRAEALSEGLCGAVEQAAALDPTTVLQTVIDTVEAQADGLEVAGPSMSARQRTDVEEMRHACLLLARAARLLRSCYSGAPSVGPRCAGHMAHNAEGRAVQVTVPGCSCAAR